MTDFNHPEYYERREREQRALSRSAIHPDIAIFHRELADRYYNMAAEVRILVPSGTVKLP